METSRIGDQVMPHGTPNAAAMSRRWLFVLLLAVPLAIMFAKLVGLPPAHWLNRWFSLTDIPKQMRGHVEYVLFVPLSAIVVSFFRLSLGLPVLSLFRPILVAVAFRVIGIPIGLAFLALVLGSVIVVRPLLKGAHYYSRVPVQLSLVAMFIVAPLIAGRLWPHDWLRHLAYFPIISLCLICEAFTKALDEKGLPEAAWPAVNTIVIGALITLIARIPGTLHVLLRFPELLLAQTGIVLLIGEYLHFELLKGKNPFVRKNALKTQFEENTFVQQILLPVNTTQIGGPSI